MRLRTLFNLALFVAASGLAGLAAAATLQPYRSEAEFNTALERWRAQAQGDS